MKTKYVGASLNKCDSCGSNLIYDPDLKCLHCPACKKNKVIKTSNSYLFHDFNIDSPEIDANEVWENENKAMKCSNCGATVVLKGFEISSICPYCDTSLVSTSDAHTKIKPDAIIPFAFGPQKASELFKNKIKKAKLAPKKFKEKTSPDSIHGYYFPAFIYNARCKTNYTGTLYEEYDDTDRNGNSVKRRRYFNIAGSVDTSHNNIEIEASTKIEQLELLTVRPYDFKEAQCFSNDYLAGYTAECYSSSVKDTFAAANAIIKSEIRDSILKRYSYDGVSWLNMQTTFNSKNYSYFMLPMYRVNFNYKNKKYSHIINGQTGKVGGDIPKSKLKIALIVIGIILGFLLPIILAFML